MLSFIQVRKVGVYMNWVSILKQTIDYIEDHITEDICADDAARAVNISSYYLQKGFQIVTDYSVNEYIRCRRLYLAALDVISTNKKIIDIAFDYFYDTPESFTKAFTRFHGVPPTQLRKNKSAIKTFLPLTVTISVQGGNNMDFSAVKLNSFKVIGYQQDFSFDNSYEEIPKFWSRIYTEKIAPLFSKSSPETPEEETILNCKIGEYGVCIDDLGDGKFRYLIAGKYNDGVIPYGMTVYEFPALEWVKFKCVGPMPGSLQTVNTKIFREWLPQNDVFEIAMGANVEWYSAEGSTTDADYKSEIWIPVIRK